MSDFADRLIRLPSSELKRRLTLRGKCRGEYQTSSRPSRSDSELLDYIRQNDIRSRGDLLRLRGPTDPAPYDYVKMFGSWSEALSKARYDTEVGFDRHYVVMSVVEFGLWTEKSYISARSKRPDVMPSLYAVKKEFGSWGVVKDLSRAFSLKETMAVYVELRDKLGKKPTMDDCRRIKLDIGMAVKMFGSKKKFDQFIASMEEII